MKDKLKNFLKGYGSILSIFGTSEKEEEKQTDAEKLYGDWAAIGNDMRKVMSAFDSTKLNDK